ncbi:unnamed protein product [Amoebophrya sp. A120]|nr:unnamed protein product [Amoebophrya sp. A120]|eukprot:GSA120T00006390001.1
MAFRPILPFRFVTLCATSSDLVIRVLCLAVDEYQSIPRSSEITKHQQATGVDPLSQVARKEQQLPANTLLEIANHWESRKEQARSSKSDLADFGYRNAIRRALTDNATLLHTFKEQEKYRAVIGGAELDSGYAYLRYMRDLYMMLSVRGQAVTDSKKGDACLCYRLHGSRAQAHAAPAQQAVENMHHSESSSTSATGDDSSSQTSADLAQGNANAQAPVSISEKILYPKIEGLHQNEDEHNFHRIRTADFGRDSWLRTHQHVFARNFCEGLDLSLLFANETDHARVRRVIFEEKGLGSHYQYQQSSTGGHRKGGAEAATTAQRDEYKWRAELDAGRGNLASATPGGLAAFDDEESPSSALKGARKHVRAETNSSPGIPTANEVKSSRCCESTDEVLGPSEQGADRWIQHHNEIEGTRRYFAHLREMDKVGQRASPHGGNAGSTATQPPAADAAPALSGSSKAGSGNAFDWGDPVGAVSATMLGYAKQVLEMETLFGSLQNFRIAEIGVGFGGLCHALFARYKMKIASYTLIDLPEAEQLALRTLQRSLVAVQASLDSGSTENVEHNAAATTGPRDADKFSGGRAGVLLEMKLRTYNSRAEQTLRRSLRRERKKAKAMKNTNGKMDAATALLRGIYRSTLQYVAGDGAAGQKIQPDAKDVFVEEHYNSDADESTPDYDDDQEERSKRHRQESLIPNPAVPLAASGPWLQELVNATKTHRHFSKSTAGVYFSYDLCISNYAFNELVDERVAGQYVRDILRKCKRVFITWGLAAADTGAAFGGLQTSKWQVKILNSMWEFSSEAPEKWKKGVEDTAKDHSAKRETENPASLDEETATTEERTDDERLKINFETLQSKFDALHHALVPFFISVHDVPVMGGSIWAEATNRLLVYMNPVVSVLEPGSMVYNWQNPWDWETGFGRRLSLWYSARQRAYGGQVRYLAWKSKLDGRPLLGWLY